MNTEELVRLIKKRPQTFIGKMNLNSLYNFVAGFRYCNVRHGRADEKDEAFKAKFSEWVEEWIKNNRDIKCEDTLNYPSCIEYVCDSQEEAVMLYLDLAEKFFDEMNKDR